MLKVVSRGVAMVLNMVAVVGSYIVAVNMWGVDPGHFMTKIIWFVTAKDVLSGLIKATVFGVVISVISCSEGMRTVGGADGVGRSTRQAVVNSLLAIFVANYTMTTVVQRLFYSA